MDPMRNTTQRPLLLLLAALTLPLLAASLPGCNKPAAASEKKAEAPPLHVDTADVQQVEAPIVLRLTGTLRGLKEADLAANASGKVLKLLVERGDEVKGGQPIAELDTSASSLQLNEAQVQVALSKKQLEINQADCARYDKLIEAKAISGLEYDQAVAKCKTAPLSLQDSQARVSIAAKNVGDGTIRAPFDGIVSERYVEVGEYVASSSKVVSMVEKGDLRLQFTVPEANVAAIKVGTPLSFTVRAYSDKSFPGTVKFISGSLRSATRDLVVEAVVPNPNKELLPGMFTDISLSVGTQSLPSVPLTSVFEQQDKKRVYAIVDGRLEERVLEYGAEVNGRLAVINGVKAGDKVAIGDLTKLINGASVE